LLDAIEIVMREEFVWAIDDAALSETCRNIRNNPGNPVLCKWFSRSA